jgi:hypothetical protein
MILIGVFTSVEFFPPKKRIKTIKEGGFFPTEGIGILRELFQGKNLGKNFLGE